MTISAHRGVHLFFFQQRNAMDALLIAHNWTVLAQMKPIHLRNVAMATSAGLGQVSAIDWRSRIAVVEQIMIIAVAGLAGRCLLHPLVHSLSVIAVPVNICLDTVTLRAGDRLGNELVRMGHLSNIGMATCTKILRMNRTCELCLINIKRYDCALSVLLRQILVTMAHKAIRVFYGNCV